jgi:hypothetical protein
MADIAHQWGSDLSLGPGGDIALAAGSALGQQRVLRRLLTNPGDYIWQLGYGAGLAALIGSPAEASRIAAVIRSQIFKESIVAQTPEPVITVQAANDGSNSFYAVIAYVDANTGVTQTLSFPVGA